MNTDRHFARIARTLVGSLAVLCLVLSSGAATLGIGSLAYDFQIKHGSYTGVAQAAAVALTDDTPASGTTTIVAYPAYCPQLSQTLQKGASDAATAPAGQVSELQHFLSGYYSLDPSEIMTGTFGSVTQNFVMRFQQERGLPNFGVAGSLTREAMSAACGGPVVSAPTCTVAYAPATVARGAALSTTWSATDATSRTYMLINTVTGTSTGPVSVAASGSLQETISLDAGTYARTDTVVGPGGTATCAAQLTVTGSALWPLIYGQAGSYYVSTAQNLADMDALGMHLMISLPGGAPLSAFPANHAKYISTTLADMIVNTICPSGVCTVSQTNINSVLSQAQAYLNSVANDPNVVGFWILDDYPGADVHAVIEQVHALVAQANQTSVVKRPTVCGLGAHLTLLGAQPTTNYSQTIKNITPAGCDIVGIYSYAVQEGAATNPAQFDWSMSAHLPGLFRQLQLAGWDLQKLQVIGLTQAFGVSGAYVTPRRADIAQQSAAFCNAGASAITAFSWDTSSVGPAAGLVGAQEPYNNADIKQGLIDGVGQCRTIWDARLLQGGTTISLPPPANDTQRKQDLQTLKTALNAYYAKHGTFNVAGSASGGSGNGVVSADGLPTYKTIIQGLYADGDLASSANLPASPAFNGDYYMLYVCSGGQSFALSAKLDSPTSADITNIQNSCNGTGGNGTYSLYGRNYAVVGTAPTPTATNDDRRKQDLQTLKTALNAYYAHHGTYTVSGSGAGGGGNGVVSADGLPTYKTIIRGLYDDGDLSSSANLPTSPAAGSDYYMLYVCSGGQSFALSAKLDSPTSADITNIQNSCNGTGGNGTYSLYGRNYAVTN